MPKGQSQVSTKQTELSSTFVGNFSGAISSLHGNNLRNYNKILITVKAGQVFSSLTD